MFTGRLVRGVQRCPPARVQQIARSEAHIARFCVDIWTTQGVSEIAILMQEWIDSVSAVS